MPLLRALPWVLWLALVLFSVATYTNLPEQIPQRFDASGEVTKVMSKSLVTWFLLPAIAGAVQLLLSWMGTWASRKPELFNFPEKERFLKIPPAYRGPVIERLREMVDITGAFTMLVMAYVQVMIWRAALGQSPGGMSVGLIVVTVLFTPFVFILLSRANAAVDEAERRWKSAEGPAGGR